MVTGTVLTGSVDVDDRVTISPRGIVARVRSIHAQNRVATTGRSGERCALNLAGEGVSKDAATRGDIVLDPSLHAPTDRIDATLRVLAGEKKPIGQWTPVRLHHAAAEVGAHLVLFADQPVDRGSEAFVQLVLERTIAAAVGDRTIAAQTSALHSPGQRVATTKATVTSTNSAVAVATVKAIERPS